jgi:hypothetical protein
MSNIPAVPNGQTGKHKDEQTDEMRLKSVFSTAVPPRLNHAVAVGNDSLISFRETWSSDSKGELRRHTDTHTNTWYKIFFLLQKKERVGIYLKFVIPNDIFYKRL